MGHKLKRHQHQHQRNHQRQAGRFRERQPALADADRRSHARQIIAPRHGMMAVLAVAVRSRLVGAGWTWTGLLCVETGVAVTLALDAAPAKSDPVRSSP